MNIMALKKENDELPKKRIVEFDMFVRDLEPEQDEKIRGGKTANQHKPGDSKIDGTDGADFARFRYLRGRE
jgi:hypothetical protein